MAAIVLSKQAFPLVASQSGLADQSMGWVTEDFAKMRPDCEGLSEGGNHDLTKGHVVNANEAAAAAFVVIVAGVDLHVSSLHFPAGVTPKQTELGQATTMCVYNLAAEDWTRLARRAWERRGAPC